MARTLNKLSARGVAAEKRSGRHGDGGGLYLSISDNGGKRWVFLFKLRGRSREMGLGSFTSVSLAKARELAADARQNVAQGLDPIETRPNTDAGLTFSECAKRYIEANKPGWKNAKHAQQWQNTLYDAIARQHTAILSGNHTDDDDLEIEVIQQQFRDECGEANAARKVSLTHDARGYPIVKGREGPASH
ncbi:protein of unknown function [Tardiphaga sp. OK246]|jgi:hypothetical protein|uniref:Arm DNA-binding domain-containing protein n=1 Tax=Tardiphaga sp. OK246 TaxID=1855307 RepID=UPI000B70A3AF|nr:Arm DNA-binding domain-containing protein [Tardiphaga sp. OK246]SNT09891.1 protein of unknown function [Tardiphaga sp. OK246]